MRGVYDLSLMSVSSDARDTEDVVRVKTVRHFPNKSWISRWNTPAYDVLNAAGMHLRDQFGSLF